MATSPCYTLLVVVIEYGSNYEITLLLTNTFQVTGEGEPIMGRITLHLHGQARERSYREMLETYSHRLSVKNIKIISHSSKKSVQQYYDEINNNATLFILDEDGMVFHQGMNFFPVGRNINEFLRLIDAYAHNQKFGEVCPANWEEGKDAMKENRDGVADYLAKH